MNSKNEHTEAHKIH